MLDLKLLQKQPEVVAKALADRHSSISVDEFLELDARRRAALTEVETLKSRRNAESAEVARKKRAGEDASELVAELGKLSDHIKELDAEVSDIKEKVYQWMLSVPNIPDASVPVGLDENDNPELHRWGTPREFPFPPRQHFEVGAARKGLDFERGAKLAGSRFCVSHGVFARLERALMNFYLDTQTTEFGATEILPPFMVNAATMQGTGQLPKFEEDLFKMPAWDYYLIPTAEVPVTNLHAGEILEEDQLPLRYTAGTPCFRSEAGSAGKDVRGLIRQHQFIKVEMVRFAHPDKSWEELENMRRCAEILLESWSCPTAPSPSAPATWASVPPRPTMWKCGCPVRTPTAKFPPAPTAWTSRPVAPTSASVPRAAASLNSCTPSTAPACPPAVPWWP